MPLSAALNLDKLKAKGAVARLIRAPSYREDANVRRAAAEAWAAAQALGEIGDGQAVEQLLATLEDRSSDVCQAAVWALGIHSGVTQMCQALASTLACEPGASLCPSIGMNRDA